MRQTEKRRGKEVPRLLMEGTGVLVAARTKVTGSWSPLNLGQ